MAKDYSVCWELYSVNKHEVIIYNWPHFFPTTLAQSNITTKRAAEHVFHLCPGYLIVQYNVPFNFSGRKLITPIKIKKVVQSTLRGVHDQLENSAFNVLRRSSTIC